jgi:preprotein translocase subunit SecE
MGVRISPPVLGLNKKYMNKVVTWVKDLRVFIIESFEELRTRVTWPKSSELQSNSVLVVVASLIFAVVIGLVDRFFDTLVSLFYKTF